MAQVLVMYKQPADPAAFDEYFASTHAPIFARTPGIRRLVLSNGPITPVAGGAGYRLIAVVDFDTMEDLQAGLASEAAQAAVADLQNFAQAGVDILIYDTR